jgi:hypothetical protein
MGTAGPGEVRDRMGKDVIGRSFPITPGRRLVRGLMEIGMTVPTIIIEREMRLGAIVEIRRRLSSAPSWIAIFSRAFALAGRVHPELRRAYIRWPIARIYEHPETIASVMLEKEFRGEFVVVNGLLRNPDRNDLDDLNATLRRWRDEPAWENAGVRRALRTGMLPGPLSRFILWQTFHVSGAMRARRVGTFGITSLGQEGAHVLRAICPLSYYLTFGPIGEDGRVRVQLHADHRVIDGMMVARSLATMERELLGSILTELAPTPRAAAA